MSDKDTPAQPRFRLVIVGCGAITESSHLPAALSLPHVEVTALVDPSTERTKQLVQQFGLRTRALQHLDDALDLADGILIATPNHTHFPLAVKALSNGVPILVEKPLTTHYEDAVELCRLAQEKRVVLAVGFSTRFYPGNRLMKKLLTLRYFGTIKLLRYQFGTWGGWSPYSMYNLDRKAAGGGVLVVSGSHLLDRLIYWFGFPEVLEYVDDSYGGPEAHAVGKLRFKGPGSEHFEATFVLSKTVQLRNHLSIETDRYVIQLAEEQTGQVVAIPHDNPQLRLAFSDCSDSHADHPATRLQLVDFVASVFEGRKPMVDGWAASQSVMLTEQLYAIRQQLPEPWMWYSSKQGRTDS